MKSSSGGLGNLRDSDLRQLLLYGVIGLSGVFLDFVTFALFAKIFSLHYQLANWLSTSIGICNNFFWNRSYNFRVFDQPWLRFLRFYAIGSGGLGVTVILLYLLVERASLDELFAKGITIPVVVLLQFCLNKRFSFS